MILSDPHLSERIDEFLLRESLDDEFRTTLVRHYLALADYLYDWLKQSSLVPVIGINGAQGSGKSTLSALLKLVLEYQYACKVQVLSIDDIYLTREERFELARSMHPLLKTRGVPGTHDVKLGLSILNQLKTLKAGQQLQVPGFNKATDNRQPQDAWETVHGPIDCILFEGWCVGTEAVESTQLSQAINQLEAEEDPAGIWRNYVNEQLRGPYRELFSQLDYLIFLQAPGFHSVKHWRLEQEQKLAARINTNSAEGLMNASQIERFIQHYQRLTCQNLKYLPQRADIVLKLDDKHQVTETIYQS